MTKIIAADIGNTETTIGIKHHSNWTSYRFTTRDSYTPDELLALFNSTFQLNNETLREFNGSIVCSVVPQLTNNLTQALSTFIEKDPIVVGPGVKTGLKVNIFVRGHSQRSAIGPLPHRIRQTGHGTVRRD